MAAFGGGGGLTNPLLDSRPWHVVGLIHEPDDLSSGWTSILLLSREEPRFHIHVQGEEGEAKFWLAPDIELANNWGLSERKLRSAERLIREHSDEIRAAWKSHFGG